MLTAQRSGHYRPSLKALIRVKVAASTTLYYGQMLMVASTGGAIGAEDGVSGKRILGVCVDGTVDNSVGALGDEYVTVDSGGAEVEVDFAAPTFADQSAVGTVVYLIDDITVDTSSGDSLIAGSITEIDIDASTVWVALKPFAV